jgi:hypothetical protein
MPEAEASERLEAFTIEPGLGSARRGR